MSPLLPGDLRELIRGTPFPDPSLCSNPLDPIDWEAAVARWLSRTAEWRSQLAAMGQPYPTDGLAQIVAEAKGA